MAAYRLESPCTVDDAEGLAKNNMSAFWENPWWSILWADGSLDNRIIANGLRQPVLLLKEREVRRHQKIIETATGEIVGYARWIMPASLQDGWLEAQVPDVSDEDKKRFDEMYAKADFTIRNLEAMDDPILEMQTRLEPKGPFIKLDYLAVRPDHQRKGVASMLLQPGIEQSEKLGADLFLVALGQRAADMYAKNGFEILEKNTQSLSKWGGREEDLYEAFSVVRHPSGGKTA